MSPSSPNANLRTWLGLNASTVALLGAILLITASTELWAPIVPQYLKAPTNDILKNTINGPAYSPWLLLLIGLYGLCRDGLEAVNYFAGGYLAGRLNTRRALLLFNILPLVGFAIIGFWTSRPEIAVFLAVPFIFVWDSIAGPATITVVGDAIPPDRRTMAFSLQAIFRRLSRIVAYLISAAILMATGSVALGFRIDLVVSAVLVLLAVALQFRFMRTSSSDTHVAIHQPRRLLRSFPSNLKRLLAADILARWAEGLAGPFIILHCVPILSNDPARGTALYQSVLLNIQAVTNIALYLLIGPLASREGLAKKPFIGLTFIFFALFPLSLALFGSWAGLVGLAAAFVIGGLREIGEPARKAMIADLVPPNVRTQSIGLYWSVRSLAVMWASPVGALAWIAGDHLRPGTGPYITFTAAGVVGLLGAAVFFLRFGRPVPSPSQGEG